MTRAEFSKRTKLQAFDRAGGRCELCGVKLSVGYIEYDHAIPCVLGGEATLDNCVVACRSCHRLKTSSKDIPIIAKSNRQRAKHIGIKRGRSSFQTNRDGPFRKRMNGTVERR